jgi:RimJ/RimL family protein N-acetyltransferase
MNDYIFSSERLGFRNWTSEDVDKLFELNSKEEVMRYFPATQTRKQCENFIERMKNQFDKNNFCYFAVELKETKNFIGFIGICEQTYEAEFNPSVDIGWRILPKYWAKGYATEGAKRCLEFGFNNIKLDKIVAVAPSPNIASITVMKKIGMQLVQTFNHPLLNEFPELKECVLYELDNSAY